MAQGTKATSRKQWSTAIVGVSLFVFLLVFGMWISDPNRGKPTPREVAMAEAEEVRKDYKAKNVDVLTNQDRWIAKSEEELTTYQRENRQLRQDQVILQKKLENYEQRLRDLETGKNATALPLMGSSSPATGALPPPPQDVPVLPPGTPAGGQTKQDDIQGAVVRNMIPPPPQPQNRPNSAGGQIQSSIQVFDFDDESATSKKGEDMRNVANSIPSGSFAKVVLLSGVNAPTGGEADSNPLPILMRVVDLGTLPNYFNSEIRDCHITGDVRGDLSSERAKIRTERLSCVLINGDIVEKPIKGWVNGEDGVEGFRGRVVEKTGALLARTFFSGLFSGIGDTVAAQYNNVSTSALGTVTTVDPSDMGKQGLASGASNALDKLADYYMKRANEIYPIIELSANRVGEVVLQEGVDLGKNIAGNIGTQK